MRKKNIKASLINLTLNMRYKMTKKYQICHHQIRFFQAQNAPKSVFGRGSDREKVACWRTKAAISLKRVKIKRKSYCGRPIETQQRSFGRYHPWPFMASPSSRLGVCNLATPLISGTGKATDFKFWRNIHRVDRNKSPWKMLGIVAVGVVRESRKF